MIWFVNKILIWFIYCQNVCDLNVLKNLIWDGMLLIAKNMSNWGTFGVWRSNEVNFIPSGSQLFVDKILILSKYEVNILLTLS